MIERYSDHAANERTFLAWIRTAIAVAAFGFLVEKFDLFLKVASRSLGGREPSEAGQLVADVTGLLIIALAGVMSTRPTRAALRDDGLAADLMGLRLALRSSGRCGSRF